jgi:predicted secreted protein
MSQQSKVLAMISASLMALSSQAQTPPAPQGVLLLTASAVQEVSKDTLSLAFSVQKEGADAAAVQGQLKLALDAALAEARKAARPGALEVQTGGFGLYPRYAPKGGVNGWQGQAELLVEGRDTAAVAALVGRIQSMTLARVAWGLSREAREKAEADVAAQAIGRWRQKADLHARQFGYSGYVVREVNVTGSDQIMPSPAPLMRMRASAAAAPGAEDALPTEGGKAQVSVNVSGSIQMK